MNRKSLLSWWNAVRIPFVRTMLFCCALAVCGSSSAQITVISADNLTPFQPRDVGTTSDAKTVRIKLNYARAISSIAVAPGYTEFAAGAVSGCVADGYTVNPALSTCSMDVTFSPKYPGLRTAPLVMTDGTGIKSSIGLEGIGLAPRASLTPGIITTVAGTGTYGFSGDGGPATSATLSAPYYVVFDQEGNFYISDTVSAHVRKVDPNGIISTVAGGGTTLGDGGPATSAKLNNPLGLAVDAAGNLYIADTDNYRVRKVDRNGIISTVAGTGIYGFSGDGGPATSAMLAQPYAVVLDAAGNLYIADPFNNRVRKVDRNGIITTFAGNGTNSGPLGDGGPATGATLNFPEDDAADTAGNLYIADAAGHRIRKVDPNGIITTYAGTGIAGFSGDDGPATQAEFNNPSGVSLDAAGDVYVSDYFNSRIRRVDTHGVIKTIAGHGVGGNSGDGGPATKAGMQQFSVTIDSSGSLFLPDYYGRRVRKVDVSQSAVNFASQNVGTVSSSQEAIVTNTGNQHIEFTGLSLAGDFEQLTGTARDCTDTTFLGAGYSCALRITFSPTAAGSLTGSATVTDNSLSLPGTKQTVSLSGTGTNP
jgi:sugar lactone lactonase YvrE